MQDGAVPFDRGRGAGQAFLAGFIGQRLKEETWIVLSEVSAVVLEQTLTMRRQHNTDVSVRWVGLDSRPTPPNNQALTMLHKLREVLLLP